MYQKCGHACADLRTFYFFKKENIFADTSFYFQRQQMRHKHVGFNARWVQGKHVFGNQFFFKKNQGFNMIHNSLNQSTSKDSRLKKSF